MHGEHHKKIIETSSKHLRKIGFEKEAKFIEDNIVALKEACSSPDKDYSNIKIPNELIPDQLKSSNTSLIKFEHVLPNDIPFLLDIILKFISKNITHTPYQFADKASTEWFNKAITAWKSGDRENAIYHLGRTLHLIQDICVPMHCSLFGNIVEVLNLISKKSSLQEDYEKKCEEQFNSNLELVIDKNMVFNFPKDILNIANDSRKYLDYCDGIQIKNWISKINNKLKEDETMCINWSNETALKNTILVFHTFFKTVGYK